MQIFQRLTGVSAESFPRLKSVAFHRPPVIGPRSRGDTAPAVLRLDPSGWGIRRSTLDGLLLDACGLAGVDVRYGTRAVDTDHRNGSWNVAARTTTADGTTSLLTFQSRRLVRADGRRPVSGSVPGAWVGRKSGPAPARRSADLDIHFMAGGYYGVSAVEDGELSFCGVSRDRAPAAWNGDAGAEPGSIEAVKGTPRFALGPVRPRDLFSFAVGDARATWPPLAGDGITMALFSGAHLGERLADSEFDAAAWQKVWTRRFGGALKRSLNLHAALQNRHVQSAVLSGAASSRTFGEWLLRRSRFIPETMG
jgi:2-polyprenyl-6-methoxyphenol hydroxylase-like FAD-dependent oxidoreductase